MTRRNSKGEALPAAVPDGGSYDDHQIAEKETTLTYVDTPATSTDEATGGQNEVVRAMSTGKLRTPDLGDVPIIEWLRAKAASFSSNKTYARKLNEAADTIAALTGLSPAAGEAPRADVGRLSPDAEIRELLIAALEECSFQLGTLVAATGQYRDVYASSLDRATAVIKKARG